MDKHQLAALSLMNESEAEAILNHIQGMAFWTPEMVVELSCHGFRASEILEKLTNDPMYLLVYLAAHNA